MWSISTHSMASVHSLTQAQTVWDAAKPWKNQLTSWRPLDGRRMFHKRIVKLSDNAGYGCVLFNTAMVTYLTDGSVKLRCDDRVSSSAFSYRVAPRGCCATSHKGKMYWRVRTDDGDHYYREGAQALHLKPTAAGNWLLVNEASPETEWAFDRKLGAQARKLVAPYTLWYTVSQRMGVKLPTYIYDDNWAHPSISILLANPGNPATIAQVAPEIGPPVNARHSAYLHLGARHRAPVPSYRLPRS